MNSLYIFIVFLILYNQALSQNNPSCRAKRFLCTPFNVTVTGDYCMHVDDEQEKWNYLKECDLDGYMCPTSTATYLNPAVCIVDTTSTDLLAPGSVCETGSVCHSTKCEKVKGIMVCVGKDVLLSCNTHLDCDIN